MMRFNDFHIIINQYVISTNNNKEQYLKQFNYNTPKCGPWTKLSLDSYQTTPM